MHLFCYDEDIYMASASISSSQNKSLWIVFPLAMYWSLEEYYLYSGKKTPSIAAVQ